MAPAVQAQLQLDGIVLHMGKLGEAHRLVEVLTAEWGRVTLVARGARASRRRFAGVLELFTTLRLQVQKGRGLWTLLAADPVTPRFGIRTDLVRISRASGLCACVRRLWPEHQAASDAYAGLTAGLDAVAEGRTAEAAALYPALAAAAGILPELDRCGRCGATDRALAVDPGGTALVCGGCAPALTPLASETLRALGGAPVLDEVAARVVEACVIDWVGWHTGRPLREVTSLLSGPERFALSPQGV
jgi:DNA repair protein RecO (recombination protein O)